MSNLIPTNDLVIRLKSGEYDGGDLMQAWCRLQTLEAKIKELDLALEVALEDKANQKAFCENVFKEKENQVSEKIIIWWNDIGSGIRKNDSEDLEEFCTRLIQELTTYLIKKD